MGNAWSTDRPSLAIRCDGERLGASHGFSAAGLGPIVSHYARCQAEEDECGIVRHIHRFTVEGIREGKRYE
jgi:hypothetical protein